MSSVAWSRRSFLRAVGVGAASLPFFKLLEQSAVYAQTAGGMPLRFIGVYFPHGAAFELWRPKASGADFDISYENCSLQPFDDAAKYGASFKKKIVVIDGLDNLSGANGHDTAATILTGSKLAPAAGVTNSPGNSSIDQYLAVEKGLGAATRLSSIALGVGNNGTESGSTLSYSKGVPLPKIIDPSETFTKLFGSAVSTTANPADKAAAERKQKIGQSVVDFIRKDINRLHARLAPPEQQKLDQHLTSLREIEKQLAGFQAAGGCVIPAQPKPTGNADAKLNFSKLQSYNGGEPFFDRITDLQIDMMAQAMACDITRFGTLYMNDLSRTGYPAGLPDDVHGGVAHTYSGSHDGNGGAPVPGTPSTWIPLAVMNKYSFSKCARLLQRLNEMGILDSTLVLMASDMGDPSAHSTQNAPYVLGGGLNGKIKMGRNLTLAGDCPPNKYYCNDTEKTLMPNGRLLASIVNAFGVEAAGYGNQTDPKLAQGTLSELM